MQKKSIGGLIGTVAAIIIVILICIPIINTIKNSTDSTKINAAVTNAYTAFLYQDNSHVSYTGDVLFVFEGKVIKVIGNNIKRTEILEEYEDISKAKFSEVLTSGTYEKGIYVVCDEEEYLTKSLNVGDSLIGLCEATNTYSFNGYAFYGHLEKCDIYTSSSLIK